MQTEQLKGIVSIVKIKRSQLSFSVVTVQVVKIYPNIKEQPITKNAD